MTAVRTERGAAAARGAQSQPTGPLIRALGAVRVVDTDGVEIRLSDQKREILGALIASSGRPVERGELCVALWGDDTPIHRQRLKSQVAQLRRLLPGGVGISHGESGLRLVAPNDTIDVERFLSAVHAADIGGDAAMVELADALDLWTGTLPFVGIGCDLVVEAGWQLTVARERSVVSLCRMLEAAGDHASVIARLMTEFDAALSRADLAGLLAHAYAELGNVVEALNIVQRHQRALIERGLQVSPELADLEQRVLHNGLTARADGPTLVSPVGVAYVSRPLVERALQRGLMSKRVVVLVGEAGAGKTTVAEHCARLRSRHIAVVRVESQPSRPMEPIRDCLRAIARHDRQRFDGFLTEPHFGDAWGWLDGSIAAGMERDALLAALGGLIAAATPDDLTIVLDDLHHCDHNTRLALRAAAAGGASGLVGTSRTIIDMLDGLVERVDVGPLTESECDALLGQQLGSVAPALAEELRRRSGRNPLLLKLLADSVSEGEVFDRIPASVRAVVHQRVGNLSRGARQTLEVAALLGSTFEVSELIAVDPGAESRLDEAVADGLVVRSGGVVRFAHDLVGESIRHDLAEGRRVSLHDEICTALARTGGVSPMSLARHAIESAALDPIRAARYGLLAARQQAAAFGWTETDSLASQALDLLPDGELVTDVRAELLLLRGSSRRRIGLSGSRDDLILAAEFAVRRNDGECLVRATTELCSHGMTSELGSVDADVLRLLDGALEAPAVESDAIALRSAAATLLISSDQWPRGRALYGDALALSAETDSCPFRREVLMNAHVGLGHPGDLDRRILASRELAAYGDTESRWESAFLSFAIALVRGDRDSADEAAAVVEDLGPKVMQRSRIGGTLKVRAVTALLNGNLEQSRVIVDDALRQSRAMSESWSVGVTAGLLVPVLDAMGSIGQLLPTVASMRAHAPSFPTWKTVHAFVASMSSERKLATRLLDELVADDFALIEDFTWTAAMTLAGRAAFVVRHEPACRIIAERVQPFDGQMSWNGISTHGPIAGVLALAADVAGNNARARQLAVTALSELDAFRTPHLAWPELRALATG